MTCCSLAPGCGSPATTSAATPPAAASLASPACASCRTRDSCAASRSTSQVDCRPVPEDPEGADRGKTQLASARCGFGHEVAEQMRPQTTSGPPGPTAALHSVAPVAAFRASTVLLTPR